MCSFLYQKEISLLPVTNESRLPEGRCKWKSDKEVAVTVQWPRLRHSAAFQLWDSSAHATRRLIPTRSTRRSRCKYYQVTFLQTNAFMLIDYFWEHRSGWRQNSQILLNVAARSAAGALANCVDDSTQLEVGVKSYKSDIKFASEDNCSMKLELYARISGLDWLRFSRCCLSGALLGEVAEMVTDWERVPTSVLVSSPLTAFSTSVWRVGSRPEVLPVVS